jgi:excisionase family DNA binding protein
MGVDMQSNETLAFKISEACAAARIGRTSLYEAIKRGQLPARKRGKSTLILANDLRRWLESLPAVVEKTNV